MAAKRSEIGEQRTRARRQALQMLFAKDFAQYAGVEENEEIAPVMDDTIPDQYACEIYEGVNKNQSQIDSAIESVSQNWALSRMPSTDRSILRIAVFELMYRDDIPSGVAINEAVELAQDFGGEDDSFRFINGVLGTLASGIDGSKSPDSDETAEDGDMAATDSDETAIDCEK